ncbi:hypothetical protein K461DRAFT_314477 [Myriangium duriaei CBS 260.36]|uniref:HTH myb-type domain-containing protein n=1 Tax=Myriangium duriaei CBS 260.36 TaxID=1168546 RepID=A0A9P4J126_9PEZI|nr:hypothetical protein K461DRAFT_314477 [Myriangium duriaei CBS 260.36]
MPPLQPNCQPTSLDFINRPNPVEPSNINHIHDASSSRQLETRPNNDFLRVIQHSRHVNPRSGAESFPAPHPHGNSALVGSVNPVATVLNPESDPSLGDSSLGGQTHLTLPLPSKQDVQRHQPHVVPPVLQGLHHPPPNAGILPSMNASKSQTPQQIQGQQPQASSSTDLQQPATSSSSTSAPAPRKIIIKVPAKSVSRPARRNKWTDEETWALLQGTRRFGVGNWKKILTCTEYSFNHRTATDLKDRFRVVSSNREMLLHYKIYGAYRANMPDLSGAAHLASAATERSPTSTTLPPDADLDLDLPRAKRRQRTKWSAEEDDALLRGFGRYGPSWTSIQLDPVLKKRTPTDIRDRIRTRFSEEYTKAGLTPKPSKPRVQIRSQPRGERGEEGSSPSTAVEGGSAASITDEGSAETGRERVSLPSIFASMPGVEGGEHPG